MAFNRPGHYNSYRAELYLLYSNEFVNFGDEVSPLYDTYNTGQVYKVE